MGDPIKTLASLIRQGLNNTLNSSGLYNNSSLGQLDDKEKAEIKSTIKATDAFKDSTIDTLLSVVEDGYVSKSEQSQLEALGFVKDEFSVMAGNGVIFEDMDPASREKNATAKFEYGGGLTVDLSHQSNWGPDAVVVKITAADGSTKEFTVKNGALGGEPSFEEIRAQLKAAGINLADEQLNDIARFIKGHLAKWSD